MHNKLIVLGSTGLIGKHLLTYLGEKDSSVIAISRRSINDLPKNVSTMIIDFDEFLEQGHLPDCEHIYICLGTTIKKAGSQESFKKVDLDYCLGFAKKARESGASAISVVTSVGANANSKNFYLKTKGKLENEIKAMGFDSVNIFQPGLLIGKRGETRPLEFLGQYVSFLLNMFLFGSLKKFRAIEASKVASAMANSRNNNGINYFSYEDFIKS
tara:strand:+ start:661 stop:1302 length:642 start_codon:yes stop_codon:yes gene_type:complete